MVEKKKSLQSKTSGKEVNTRTEESLEAVFAQLESTSPTFTDKHIERYFDMKSEMIAAIREDHKDEKDIIQQGRTYNFRTIIVVSILIVLVLIIIGFFNREYLGRFFELLFAFLGGTGVGGYFMSKKKKTSTD
jgi:hypothetical protein